MNHREELENKYAWGDLTDEIHSYVKLRKELGMAPEYLEESGKILGKDLWVRAH